MDCDSVHTHDVDSVVVIKLEKGIGSKMIKKMYSAV